jgi:hypothetical protein
MQARIASEVGRTPGDELLTENCLEFLKKFKITSTRASTLGWHKLRGTSAVLEVHRTTVQHQRHNSTLILTWVDLDWLMRRHQGKQAQCAQRAQHSGQSEHSGQLSRGESAEQYFCIQIYSAISEDSSNLVLVEIHSLAAVCM